MKNILLYSVLIALLLAGFSENVYSKTFSNKLLVGYVYSEVAAIDNDPLDFERSFDNDRLIIVKFYSQWCSTCRVIEPTYEAVASEYSDKIDFYEFDVDKNTQLSDNFNINLVPTIYAIYPPEEEMLQIQTRYLLSKSQFKSKLDSLLKKFNIE